MKVLIITLLFLLPSMDPAFGQRQATLFQDPEFGKRFMGSYGFLPDVEPPIDSQDKDEKAYFLAIKELLQANNMAALKAKLQRELNPDISHPALLFILGNVYFQEGNNSEAERWYQAAIRKFPSFLRAHKNLGLLHYQNGDNAQAVASLSEAVRLGDRSPQTAGLLGICHMNLENWLAADSALRQAMVLEPEKQEWKRALLRVFFDGGQFAAALSMVNTMLGEKPEDEKLWLMKGRALMELNRPEAASVAMETLRHMGEAGPEILETLGAVYMDQEKPNAALAAYSAAAAASKKLKGSSVLRTADLLFGYQYVEQAKRYVNEVRSRVNELSDQEQLELRTLEAKIARAEGDLGTAMTVLQDIVLQDNVNGEARIELAQLFAGQAKTEEREARKAEYFARAQLYFEQAMKIDDSEALAALRYGQMLVSKGDYIKAVPFLKRSYQLRPKDSVDQYIKRVERAAHRQEAREAELKGTVTAEK